MSKQVRSRAVPSRAVQVRTRSFPCPDDLWRQVERFARERDLGSTADAARILLRSGLDAEQDLVQLRAAHEWQVEQAWAEMQAIVAGDRSRGSWAEIERAVEKARQQVRRREAAQRKRGA